MADHPPFLNAGNAGPFTLDGTRTYRVGRRRACIIDPGPDVERHVRALVTWVRDAETVQILVTHGHRDHAGAAPTLARALGAKVLGPDGVEAVDRVLSDGDVVETDEGELTAVHTPGHARAHHCYQWTRRGGGEGVGTGTAGRPTALFAGDLLLGRGDTTWVAEYPGCVADYLGSLERVRALQVGVVYPAHGPPLEDVPAALDRYRDHRLARIRQVKDALEARPGASDRELLARVYGKALPPGLEAAALQSLSALIDYVRARPRG